MLRFYSHLYLSYPGSLCSKHIGLSAVSWTHIFLFQDLNLAYSFVYLECSSSKYPCGSQPHYSNFTFSKQRRVHWPSPILIYFYTSFLLFSLVIITIHHNLYFTYLSCVFSVSTTRIQPPDGMIFWLVLFALISPSPGNFPDP